MRRLAFLGALALATIAAMPTVAAPASRWTALNTALAPVNVALATDVAALNLALANAGDAQQNIYSVSAFDLPDLQKYAAQVLKNAEKVQLTMAAVQKDAQQGIRVLDAFAPEQCSVHFTGMEYTLFAAWDDTIASLESKQAPASAGTGFWLGGFSTVDGTRLPAGGPIDLVWDRVTCQGATPRPTAAPSPSAS